MVSTYRVPRQGLIYALVIGITVIVMRVFLPERTLEYEGWRALADAAFSLTLLFLIILLASAIGLKLLNRFGTEGLSPLEIGLFSSGLGLGLLACFVLALGFSKLLIPSVLAGFLLALALFCYKEINSVLGYAKTLVFQCVIAWKRQEFISRFFIVIIALIFFGVLLQTLAPPWDYDGLMYHLEGPRIFLEQKGLFPHQNRWWINMPFTIEMLFTIGMAFGSDSFSKLIHLSFAVMFVATIYSLALRISSRTVAWYSVLVLLSIPILPVWAGLAQTDFGTALYDILAIYCVFLWWDRGARKWIALSGIFMGLAFGTKYLEASAAAVLFIVIGVLSWQKSHKLPYFELGIYALSFTLVAMPWVIKNTVWFVDPLFPFLFGGKNLDPERIKLFYTYTQMYGPVHNLSDWLLLPFRLYFKPGEFEAFIPEFSSPSFLFPLIVFYPLVKRSKYLNLLLAIILARYLLWAIGPRVVRYLLPVYALLGIQAAFVIDGLIRRYYRRIPFRLGFHSLIGFLLLFSLGLQLSLVIDVDPIPVIIGRESKDAFLGRSIGSYSAIQFADQTLKKGDLILPTGDGRTYYCKEVCDDNDDQFLWHRLLTSSLNVTSFISQIRERGYTHILISKTDTDFFVLRDQGGGIRRSINFLQSEVLPKCGNRIYADSRAEIYEIICR
jgi:4-amino-4-deoxy-L-arabinose transferase-like glycosyltransferase